MFRTAVRPLAAGASVATAGAIWYTASKQVLRNDAPPDTVVPAPNIDTSKYGGLVWGSNKSKLLSPNKSENEILKTPQSSISSFLAFDVALRDLALGDGHGICVDARGDVYQWGTRHTDNGSLNRTLKGKGIIAVTASRNRAFALSATGKLYSIPISRRPLSVSRLWGTHQPEGLIELTTDSPLTARENIASISAGDSHLLAHTSTGRTFAYAIDQSANSHGQLGIRTTTLPGLSSGSSRIVVELFSRTRVDVARTPLTATSQTSEFQRSDMLHEIPSLRGINVAQAVAGSRTSYVRTWPEGRVLAFGANEQGQIGLGSSIVLDRVMVPTEISLTRNTPVGTISRCTNIYAGGDLTFFSVERHPPSGDPPSIELLACGMGQWGTLGSGTYTNAQSTPIRVKPLSGIMEFSEATGGLHALNVHSLSVSPDNGHVLATLDTLARVGPGGAPGRDLFAWGLNREGQLGTGRRASVAVPTYLTDPGTTSADTRGRLMMQTRSMDVVRDLQGSVWGKKIAVEQIPITGYGCSIVYWRLSPLVS